MPVGRKASVSPRGRPQALTFDRSRSKLDGMWHRIVVTALRVILVAALLVILLVQVVYLPWLSGEFARDFSAEAYMRWPILALAILGLLCVQIGIVCTLRLLGFTRRDEVFSPDALRWVNGIIGAFAAGSLVCVATITYQSFTVAGPPLWMLMLLCMAIAGVGLALLMTVMQTLLLRATTLKSEMEVVI